MYPYRLMVPALFIYTAFYMIPLVIGLVMSFTNWNVENLSFKGAFLNMEGNCPVDQNPEHYKDNKKVNGCSLLFKVY